VTRCFIDTNVAVYLFDDADAERQDAARQVFADDSLSLVVSTQVLLEFFVVVTRKLAVPLTVEQAQQAVEHLCELEVVATDRRLVNAGLETARQHQLSVWDAMMVEAAVESRCEVLLTEDLNDGASLRGIQIRNPFPRPRT